MIGQSARTSIVFYDVKRRVPEAEKRNSLYQKRPQLKLSKYRKMEGLNQFF